MKKLLFSLILFAALASAQSGYTLTGTLSADAVTNLNAWATTQVQMAGAATATAPIAAGDTTTTVSANDILAFNLEAVSGSATNANITLECDQ